MLTEEDKKKFVLAILSIVHYFSSMEYQRKWWIKANGLDCYSYDDAICDFFDMGEPIINRPTEYALTDIQYKVFKEFYDSLEIFSDENSWPPLFIDSPEWKQIMIKAKEVLETFNYKPPKP